jgi:hypothetical protein
MNWWSIYLSCGIATSILFILRYYLPIVINLRKEYNATQLNNIYVIFYSISTLILYSLLWPLALLPIIFIKETKAALEADILRKIEDENV